MVWFSFKWVFRPALAECQPLSKANDPRAWTLVTWQSRWLASNYEIADSNLNWEYTSGWIRYGLLMLRSNQEIVVQVFLYLHAINEFWNKYRLSSTRRTDDQKYSWKLFFSIWRKWGNNIAPILRAKLWSPATYLMSWQSWIFEKRFGVDRKTIINKMQVVTDEKVGS